MTYILHVPCSFPRDCLSLESKLLFGSLMNSEKDQDIFIQNQKGCTNNVQHFCFACMPLPPFLLVFKRVVGNHHSQSTLEKIFWPLPGSLSSSVSQFGSQNWIVRVLVSEFFCWMAVPTGGKRLWIFGKLGYNFGFNCNPICN
jgi:hypothetical protein